MKTKPIFTLCLLLLLGVSGIILLYSFSEEANHKSNGFIRLIPPHTVEPIKVFDLQFNSYVISGISSGQIYFGNISLPTHFLIANFNFNDTSILDFKTIKDERYRSPHIYIDSPWVYILDGSVPTIIHGELNNPTLKKLDNVPRFTLSLPISPATYVLRTYDKKNDQNLLSKYNLKDSSTNNFSNLLKKQQDGIFSTDGMLAYDKSLNRVIYLYYYRNEFLNLDTNLNVISKGKTIDTNTTAKITIAEIKSTRAITLSSPPLLVNKNCCADNGKLYVQSGLISNNEDRESFKNCSVVDVYSLVDNQYLYSFYIPDLRGKKVKSFNVHNNIIVAIYDHYAETFRLSTANIKAI